MFMDPDKAPDERIVVVPVEWGQLSKDTFLWYLNFLHFPENTVYVCYVPDFRRHLHPHITPEEVMEIMIETNTESEQLKKLYEHIIEEEQVRGKFVRVGGNNRWSAIVEYCRRLGASLLVLGTQPKRERLSRPPQASQGLQNKSSSQHTCSSDKSSRSANAKNKNVVTEDVGPCVGTVTCDVLDHCDCSVVVYREPEEESRLCNLRRSSLVRGSFRVRKSQDRGLVRISF